MYKKKESFILCRGGLSAECLTFEIKDCVLHKKKVQRKIMLSWTLSMQLFFVFWIENMLLFFTVYLFSFRSEPEAWVVLLPLPLRLVQVPPVVAEVAELWTYYLSHGVPRWSLSPQNLIRKLWSSKWLIQLSLSEIKQSWSWKKCE